MKESLKKLKNSWSAWKKSRTSIQLSTLKILIALTFSALAIIAAASTDIVYVPLGSHKVIDLTIAAVMLGSMIGGYVIAIPLGIIWALTSFCQVNHVDSTWPLWAIIFTRLLFTTSIVWVYGLFRRLYKGSPYNVYQAIFYSILGRNLIAIPFDIIFHQEDWFLFRGEELVIEMAVCMVAMSLLIKHLRQIHILNGVRKKGEQENERTDIVA